MPKTITKTIKLRANLELPISQTHGQRIAATRNGGGTKGTWECGKGKPEDPVRCGSCHFNVPCIAVSWVCICVILAFKSLIWAFRSAMDLTSVDCVAAIAAML